MKSSHLLLLLLTSFIQSLECYAPMLKPNITQKIVNHIAQQKKSFIYRHMSNISHIKDFYDKKMSLDLYDIFLKNNCIENDKNAEKMIGKLYKNYHHSTRMSAISQATAPTTDASTTPITADIVTEFVSRIENNKDYNLRELKTMLSHVYKAKTAKPKIPKVVKTPDAPKVVATAASSDDDEDKPRKRGRPAKVSTRPSREPTAYNKYIKQRIEALKIEKPDVSAKDLLMVAASDWNSLTKEEKETYK